MSLERKRPALSIEALESLAYKALVNNGDMPVRWNDPDHPTTPRVVSWDISGKCHAPVAMTLYSKDSVKWRNKVPPMTVHLQVKCRKCMQCRREHAAQWRSRALIECEASERTWFGTLTFSPENHFRLELASRAGPRPGSHDKAALATWQRAIAKEAGKELTKFLKRVRKNSGQPLRYLAVCELHDSEKTSEELRYRPHLHLLIHERAGCPITKRCLQSCWTAGHSNFKLAEGLKGAMYCTKYISKEVFTRVRASLAYGDVVAINDALKRREGTSRVVTDPSPHLSF